MTMPYIVLSAMLLVGATGWYLGWLFATVTK